MKTVSTFLVRFPPLFHSYGFMASLTVKCMISSVTVGDECYFGSRSSNWDEEMIMMMIGFKGTAGNFG